MTTTRRTKVELLDEIERMESRIADLEEGAGERPESEENHGKVDQILELMQHSQAGYRALSDASPHGIVTLDLGGTITSMNPEISNLSSYPASEIVGRHFAILPCLDSRDLTGYQAIFDSLIEGEVTEPFEVAIHDKDGNKRIAEINIRNIQREGETTGFLVVFRDITGRTLTAEALTLSHTRYRSLADNLNIGIYRTAVSTGAFIEVNPAMPEIFGYESIEDLMKITYVDLYQNPKTGKKFIKNVSQDGLVRNEEIHLKRKDGTSLIASVSAMAEKNERGEVEYIDGIIEDITERKRVEERVQEQRAFLGTVVESMAHPFYVIDVDNYQILLANSAADSGHLLESATCYALLHGENEPCHGERFTCPLEEVKKTGKSVTVERVHRGQDGELRVVELHAHPVLDNDGNVVQMVEYAMDVTERRRIEEELKETEFRFRRLVENSTDGIVLVDETGNIVEWNSAQELISGLKRDEVVDRPIPDIIHQLMEPLGLSTAEYEMTKNDFLLFHQTGQASWFDEAIEWEIQRPDGTRRIVQQSSYPISTREGWMMGAVVRDLTELKHRERSLRDTQDRYKELVEKASVAIMIDDEEGEVLYFNDRFADLHGYSPEEMKTQTFESLIHPDDSERVRKIHLQRMKGLSVPSRYEFRGLRKDGSTAYFEVDGVVLEERGIIAGTRSYFWDVTERKQAEALLIQSERELSIRNQINQVFLTTPDDKTYVEVLNFLLEAMDSEFGTFGYFNSDGGFVVPAATSEIYWDQCQVGDKDIIFERGTFSGIWKDAVEKRECLYNNEGPFTTPKGHVPIKNTIVSPVVYNDNVISAVHLANKNADYDEDDRKLLEIINRHMAPVLHARLERDRQDFERKQAEEELRESREQLRMLSGHLQATSEGERASIAREIHDELGQNLTAMNMDIAWLENQLLPEQEPLIEKARTISGLIYETLQRVKRIASELRPGLLDDLGLAAAIEWQVGEFHNATGIEYRLDLEEDFPFLDEGTTTTLFRIFQEILTNVARHAEATSVIVKLESSGDSAVLEVNDDGKGITREEISNLTSLGLAGMRERTILVGGEFAISGKKGRGTTVRVTCPIKNRDMRDNEYSHRR